MTVYRKPTFTGLYIRWDSFCPKKQKINLNLSSTSLNKMNPNPQDTGH